jgi:hypothetical protein
MNPDGWRPGGCVTYAAAQAVRLGLNAAAVTTCSPEVDPEAIVPGAAWHVLPETTTTTFENRYSDGRRSQRLLALARPLSGTDIPRAWLQAPIVLLGPVFHDVAEELPGQLAGEGTLLGIGAQGWLRRREGERLLPGVFEATPPWLAGDIVFLSEEDLEDASCVGRWAQRVRAVVLTHGAAGCSVVTRERRLEHEGYAMQEVDATGAGDVFAIAFLARLKEQSDLETAARFACAAAALSVRGPGIAAIGSRGEIEELMRVHPAGSRPC